MVTLGCARNEVDSEELAARLEDGGWQLADDTEEAAVVLVNTCGFIQAAALVALGAAHPRLELHVTELDPAQAPDALHAGLLDVALVHEYDYVPAEPDPGLVTRPVLTEAVYLASAAHLAVTAGSSADPVRASRALPWIVGSPGTLCHLMAVRLCQAAGFTPRIRHYADDFAAVLMLVAAGQGVAVVPELALADSPDGVRLAALSATRRTLIACRSGAQAHPAVGACVAAVCAAAAAYPGLAT
jgi:DNA-binding transcriptional LysR family regulator